MLLEDVFGFRLDIYSFCLNFSFLSKMGVHFVFEVYF